jgi:hypothetical protein
LNRITETSGSVPDARAFLGEMTRLDRSNLSVIHGFRAALIVVAPLIFGFATNQPQFIFATLGAMLITNTEGPNSSPLPPQVLLLACVTEPLAFAVGTLAGLTGLFAIPLIGLGVAIGLMAGSDQEFALAGKFTAIFFAVGVGLPGGSESAAVERFWFALLGALLAFAGSWVHHALVKARGAMLPKAHRYPILPKLADFSLKSGWFRDALAVGLASSFGLAVGVALGLPRDFWIVVTIISAVRTKFGPTLSSASMMVAGTILGALMAAAITVSIHNEYLLGALLLLFGTTMFASRGVNLGLSQISFTPFIIILLNLLYPGEWYLAEIRILDVAIGGAIAIATVYLIWIRAEINEFRSRRKRSLTPAGG